MSSDSVKCLICDGQSDPIFEVTLFRSLQRELFQCSICRSCFFPQPDWLDRAYSKAISDLDTGIAERANDIANVLTPVILSSKLQRQSFLDFGGGLGIFARVMRDRGFDFQSVDPLATPVFSIPKSDTSNAGMVTMIEVVEHLTSPLETLREVSQSAHTIFVSTHCVPESGMTSDWWYLLPDTGQHVFFPTIKGLEILAEKLQMDLTTNKENLHFFTTNRANRLTKFLIRHQKLAWMIGHTLLPLRRRNSLSASDLMKVTEQVYKEN